MSLEATMILVDNSDWARNGDYLPSRWEAQQDAVALVSNAKFQANPESSVGLMTMAGKQVELLVTPMPDSGKIMASLYGVKLSGSIHFSNALQIAQLALKHRLNVNQRQRIVVFVASPINESLPNLVTLAKKLKKNMIAVDLINLGEMDSQHIEKITQFIENVNSSDNSHLINVNPGIGLLSDSLYGTAVLGGNDNDNVGISNHGGDMNQVDPNLDPELAMALRISLEEDKERQKKIKEEEEKQKNEEPKPMEVEPQQNVGNTPVEENKKMEEEGEPLKNEEELDEEELLKRAKELSLQDPANIVQENQQKEMPEQPKKQEELFQDENFVKELLNMIPEVDQNNEEIKKAIEMLQKSKEEQKKDDSNEKK